MKKIKNPNFDKPGTIIGDATELSVAVLKSTEPIKITGKFIGDIESSSSVVIGGTGYVKGNISSEFAYICGIVEGNLDIVQPIQIAHSGNIQGSIVCGNLISDEGAILNGTCTMRAPKPSSNEYLD